MNEPEQNPRKNNIEDNFLLTMASPIAKMRIMIPKNMFAKNISKIDHNSLPLQKTEHGWPRVEKRNTHIENGIENPKIKLQKDLLGA